MFGPTMPSWLIDIVFLEAAGIILVVTGCFVAGAISGFIEIAEAERANRRHAAEERYAQMFTEMKRSVERYDQMLRCEQVLAKAESWSSSVTEPTTFYADNVAYYTEVIEYPPYGTTERR